SDERYDRVVSIARRQISISHPKLENIIVDFKHLEKSLADVRADDIFCCLGTTMATAGSREKFYEVDFTYPLTLARMMRASGATQYLLVSALGADQGSFVYYNRVKGEVEKAIEGVGFPTLHIFRPS